MQTVEFTNFTEFYNYIVDNDIEETPIISEFKRLVEHINVGCGCGKKARIERVNNTYLSLSSGLDITAQESIKSASNYDEVRMLFDGNIFFIF